MMTDFDAPYLWGVPHDEWRENQLETIHWILESKKKKLIVEAPVGSGKSAVACALGRRGTSRVITFTKNLQIQYQDIYNYNAIFGMANYPCVISEMLDLSAEDCSFPGEMHACPSYHECHYVIARNECAKSARQSMNYAYYNQATWVKEKTSDFLYLDEAHLLPDLLKSYMTIEYTVAYLRDHDLPMFPVAHPKNKNVRLRMAIQWLNGIGKIYKTEYNKLASIPKAVRSVAMIRKMKHLESEISIIDNVLYDATDYPDLFFVDWDDEIIRIIPLSIGKFFHKYFYEATAKIIMTSATIGNPNVFAKILGLGDFDYRAVPSTFPPESMPIYLPDDAPRMNSKSSETKKRKWGKLIADMIKSCDPSWAGIIHVSSYYQATDLASRLAKNGLGNRVYIPQTQGTENKASEVENRVKKYTNPIIISPVFHQGFDAPFLNFNIVAKIPFSNLDSWGYAEMQHDPLRYRWRTGAKFEQACGRIRRGYPEHYEEVGKPPRKFVGVADGNIEIIRNELSDFFLSCIRTW